MTTQARIHANRLNAQKSTGPKTPQGKAVVAQNALKHGLSARHNVIVTESQADFDLHRDALLAELDPQGPMESILADRIVSLSWRLKRADLIQNQTFDAMNEKNTTNPLAKLAKSFGLKGLALPQAQISDLNPDLTLGRIAIKDFANARVLDRFLMYERRIEHSLYKTTLELQRLHLIRNLNPSEPNPEVAPERSRSAVPARREYAGGKPVPTKSSIVRPPSSVVNPPPPFSRRRHDDALTPNSNPRTKQSHNELQTCAIGIPTHHESIQNRESSISKRSADPPTAESIQHPPFLTLPILPRLPTIQAPIMQNKPNSLRPKTPAKSYASKVYDDKPPRPTQKNKPNQTQSPLCEHQDKLRRSRNPDAHRDPTQTQIKLADLSHGDTPVLQVRQGGAGRIRPGQGLFLTDRPDNLWHTSLSGAAGHRQTRIPDWT